MFTTKKNQLFGQSANSFVNAGLKSSSEIRSGNDSLKYSSSDDVFVDQFSSASQYKAPRAFVDISKDMIALWATSPILAVMFILYLRTITRIVSLFDGTRTKIAQKGQGLKHEAIMRMIWLHINHPDTFWKNIHLFVSVGSWKDIVVMLQYDLMYHGWTDRILDWTKFGKLLMAGLENPNTSNLVKKYLPQIKAKSKCTTLSSQADTIIAKWIANLLFGKNAYQQYRKYKVSGTAHQWQQLISKHQMMQIDFNTIHGRALLQLVSGKFLKNHHLEEKYEEWILTKPIAKFTGWVWELTKNLGYSTKSYMKHTINAQYNMLLEQARVNLVNSPFRPICVLDSSGSMSSPMYIGENSIGPMRSIEVAMSSLIFLDDMLKNGYFKGHYLTFSNTCKMVKMTGTTFVDKYLTSPRYGNGGTNFMSVFEFLIDIKNKNSHISESEFPNMIVCFSDGEFNSVGKDITNVEYGRKQLIAAGFSREYANSFGFCFVDLPNTFYTTHRKPKFETFGNVTNCFYFSGYDLSPLGFLFGASTNTSSPTPTTARELFDSAMNQEILQMVEI